MSQRDPKPRASGEPCSHPGCQAHVSHPCEGCGRIAARGEYLGFELLDDLLRQVSQSIGIPPRMMAEPDSRRTAREAALRWEIEVRPLLGNMIDSCLTPHLKSSKVGS